MVKRPVFGSVRLYGANRTLDRAEATPVLAEGQKDQRTVQRAVAAKRRWRGQTLLGAPSLGQGFQSNQDRQSHPVPSDSLPSHARPKKTRQLCHQGTC